MRIKQISKQLKAWRGKLFGGGRKGPQRRRLKLSPAAIAGIIVFALFGIALYIRAYLPYDSVFVGGEVWFKGADPWYHMRLVDNLIQHFPHSIWFDPYTNYPHGYVVAWPPFYHWLIGGAAWIIGLGHPSQYLGETVGAFTPAVLGALTVIPVYFIGKELFNRWVGVISAAILVVLPGEFLSRSLLGFTDHHVAEVLFSTVIILFLIMAVKRAREKEISFSHLMNKDWAVIKKPLIYSLLAGIFLGIYLLTFVAGIMLVFIIFVYLMIQFIIDHLRGKSTDYLCTIGVLTFAIGFIMAIPFFYKVIPAGIGGPGFWVPMVIAIIAPLALSGVSRFVVSKGWRPAFYPLVLLGVAGIGLLIFWAIDPSLLHSLLNQFSVFNPSTTILTVQEARPFDIDMAWGDFTVSFFIFFISFGLLNYRAFKEGNAGKTVFLVWVVVLLLWLLMFCFRFDHLTDIEKLGWNLALSTVSFALLIYTAIKEGSADKTLLLVWCIIMLALMFGQRRFCYYFAVNAALLVGYFSWRVLDFAGLEKLLTKPKEIKEMVKAYTTKKKKKKTKKRVSEKRFLQPRETWIKVIGAGIVIFFLVFFPNICPEQGFPFGRLQATAETGAVGVGEWESALVWLRENTTEPFDDPDYYYQLYDFPPRENHAFEDYDYPETSYGIMSWWDYGHWITRLGRRIPIACPFQSLAAPIAGKFLTSQNETEANQILDELGVKYVMSDYAMPIGKFYAQLTWAGKNESDFYEIYHVPVEGGNLQQVMLYYPSYYNSTVVRLYNFNGQAVVPSENATMVISFAERINREGETYKELTGLWRFSAYEEARDFVASQDSENYRIVGENPFTSPVLLEKMEHYRLVYTTSSPYPVKIFEYTE
jgi:asparagine N-glycosylation enzyme membrane subunit Stt3